MRNVVTRALAGAAILLAAATGEAGAACFPAHFFGQSPAPQYGYFYVMPTGTNTQQSIIGRFWEVGSWETDNEGDCDDVNWVLMCNAPYPCRGNPGTVRYIAGLMNGTTQHGVCKNEGCPSGGDLTLLVQDTDSNGGAGLFLARMDETPPALLAYDFSRLKTDLTYTEIPAPILTGSTRDGGAVSLELTLPQANAAFYGLPGQAAEGPGNISGYRLFTFAGTADPGRARADWVADAVSRPYTGSDVSVTDFVVDCSNTALDVYVALGLEFDDGVVTTDYVSRSIRVACQQTKPGIRTFRKP